MQLGNLITLLENDADAFRALETLGDLALFSEVERMGAHYDETPGEYLGSAARRFAMSASDDDWLALMGSMERTADPAHVAVEKILRWALSRDAIEQGECASPAQCGCGSGAEGARGHG